MVEGATVDVRSKMKHKGGWLDTNEGKVEQTVVYSSHETLRGLP